MIKGLKGLVAGLTFLILWVVILSGEADAACTPTVMGNLNVFECTSTQSAEDVDDLALFFNSNGAPAVTISGSLGKNSSLAGDQNINTTALGGGMWVQQGNGFGELKADGTVSSFSDTPILGSTLPKSGATFNGFDGMLIRGQVDTTPADGAHGTWDGIVTEMITFAPVGGVTPAPITLTFMGNKQTGDLGTIGFDEASGIGDLVSKVTVSVDGTGQFFEVKQFAFSVPGQSNIPEPSTWVMLVSGFGLIALVGVTRRRNRLQEVI